MSSKSNIPRGLSPFPKKKGGNGSKGPIESGPAGRGIEEWLYSSRIPHGIREKVRKFAASGLPVFIQGEEGTGKTGLARAIHFWGPFCKAPFLRLSCKGLTPQNFAEEIRLRRKKPKAGSKVSLTLFLEGIENLSENVQTLLHELLTGRRIAWPGLEDALFDVQVLSSSAGDMGEPLGAGEFREDLFQLLATLSLRLPPLRERKEEIPRMVQEILSEMERKLGGKKRFSPESLRALQEYEWPGNLAELESLVLRTAVLKEGNWIEPSDLAFLSPREPSRRGGLSREGEECWCEVTINALAHEIKNPLVAIRTFAHLLPERYDDPEFREEFSRFVGQDVGRINALVENLLEFAQFSSPQSSLLDLNVTLGELLEKNEKGPGGEGRKIVTDLGIGLPPILFDKTHLSFVLRNLFENTLFGGNDHSPLRVSTRSVREAGREANFVDLFLWYNHADGLVIDFSRVAGYQPDSELQDLNLSLFLIRKVMLRNRGKMQVWREGDGGMTLRAQFPAGQ